MLVFINFNFLAYWSVAPLIFNIKEQGLALNRKIHRADIVPEFDDHNGSKTLTTVWAHTPRPQPHFPRFGTRVVSNRNSNRNNNTNIGNNEALGGGGGGAVYTFSRRLENKQKRTTNPWTTVFKRRKSFYLYEYNVAPPRVLPGRVLP